jgi:hypothetical protein
LELVARLVDDLGFLALERVEQRLDAGDGRLRRGDDPADAADDAAQAAEDVLNPPPFC